MLGFAGFFYCHFHCLEMLYLEYRFLVDRECFVIDEICYLLPGMVKKRIHLVLVLWVLDIFRVL